MKNINLNAKQTTRYSDPEWFFLAEFSLGEFMTGGDPALGLLDQRLLDMGIPIEAIEQTVTALRGYANEARVRLNQNGAYLPGRIRVFCPALMTGDATSTKTTRLCTAEDAPNPAESFHPASTSLKGGWGYYAIERGGDIAGLSGQGEGRVVEIYVYQEGQ